MKISRFSTAIAMAASLATTGCKKMPERPQIVINRALLSTMDSVQVASKKALEANPKLECYDSAFINLDAKTADPQEFLQKFQEIKGTFLEKMPREAIGEGETKNVILPNDLTHIKLDKYRKSTVIPVVTSVDTTKGIFKSLLGDVTEPGYVSVNVKACAEPSPFL